MGILRDGSALCIIQWGCLLNESVYSDSTKRRLRTWPYSWQGLRLTGNGGSLLDWHQPVVSSWLVQQLQSLWELYLLQIEVSCRHRTWMWRLQDTAARSLTACQLALEGHVFLATEVFLVSLRSDDSSRFWLSSFQHLSNFLMLCSYQKSFSSFPHFFLIWAHTKRVIQRCFPMHLAPSGIPGWLTTQVSGLPNPFSWFSPLLFFVGSTNSKRKFFLNDVQFCFYSMM